jgi:phosphoribosylanthranilate isomerase
VLQHPTGPRRDVYMDKIATASLKAFGPMPKADVPPSEDPIFVLTSSQLQEIISRALQPLQDEVAQLRGIIASQEEKIADLAATQETQADNQLIQLRLINQLREEATEEPEVDSPLLDELYKEMVAIGRKQTDFATASRMVKRSKVRLFQLKTAIALDKRFILIPSESHSQKLLIRLREAYQIT